VTALVLTLGAGCAIAETLPETSEGPTRKEYVAELEKMCKPGSEATQQAMKGARGDIERNLIPVATSKFEKAAKIFGKTISDISVPARPSADTAKLQKWFVYLNRQEKYLKEISTQLRMNHKIKAQRLTGRFIHNGTLANNATLAFGFNYCSFKFSRYGF
jgi:hypothetical protein